MQIAHLLRRAGGLITTAELHRAGISRTRLSELLDDGTLIRVRQGWYADARVDRRMLAAARVGGRLSCVSALALRGIWVPGDGDLHVAVAANSCRLREKSDSRRRLADVTVRTHWIDTSPRVADRSRLIVPLHSAVASVLRCLPAEQAAAVVDSALRMLPQLGDAWPAIRAEAPRRLRGALELVDGVCESGLETVFWQRIQPLHCLVRRQVVIPGVGRVDFLLGDRLVVEVDGRSFHAGSQDFERDRRRDAALSALGYRVLRFSYRQVMDDWPSVRAAVEAALIRGDHH